MSYILKPNVHIINYTSITSVRFCYSAVYNIDVSNTERSIKKCGHNYITKLISSKCLSNRRLGKILYNIITIICNEINNIYMKHYNINDLSLYSIIYLLLVITQKHIFDDKHLLTLSDIVLQHHTINDLIPLLCQFNILYRIKFSYKISLLLLSLCNICNTTKLHTTPNINNYITNLFLSLDKCTYKFLNLYKRNITKIYNNIPCLKDCIIKNPYLMICVNLTISNFELYKNNISHNEYYNIIIILYYHKLYSPYNLYGVCSYQLKNEFNNIITRRVELSYEHKIYMLKITKYNEFISFIHTYNIVISKILADTIFAPIIIFTPDVVDHLDKLLFFLNNNIQVDLKLYKKHYTIYRSDNFIHKLYMNILNEDYIYNILNTLMTKDRYSNRDLCKLYNNHKNIYCLLFDKINHK